MVGKRCGGAIASALEALELRPALSQPQGAQTCTSAAIARRRGLLMAALFPAFELTRLARTISRPPRQTSVFQSRGFCQRLGPVPHVGASGGINEVVSVRWSSLQDFPKRVLRAKQKTALLPAPFWCTYAWNRPTSTGTGGSDPLWLCWRGKPWLAIRWRGYAALKWSQLERQLILGRRLSPIATSQHRPC